MVNTRTGTSSNVCQTPTAMPSPPSYDPIVVNGFTFASAEDVATSAEASNADIKPAAIAEELTKIDVIAKIYKLTPSNYTDWCKLVKRVIRFTGTAAAFQNDIDDSPDLLFVWQQWWTEKLKAAAPEKLVFNANTKPIELLSKFLIAVSAKTDMSKVHIAMAFWGLKPQTSLQSLQAEIDTQMTRFAPLFPLHDGSPIAQNYQLLVCGCIQAHRPDVALLCINKSLTETLTLLRVHAGSTSAPTPTTSNKQKVRNDANHTPGARCTFCKKPGHTEAQCYRKNGRPEKGKEATGFKKQEPSRAKAVSADKPLSMSYQLDTAADEHIVYNENQFSSYSRVSRTVELADGSVIPVLGEGFIYVPTMHSSPVALRAIHIRGSGPILISLAQLIEQGYHLSARKGEPIEIKDNENNLIFTFKQQNKQFLWTPSSSVDWHAALAHVSPRAVKNTLRSNDLPPGLHPPKTTECDACAQAKFTITPGKGTLIHEAHQFLDVMHVDLVGGKDSLPPSTGASDVPAATMALTIIDEHTRYKWAIPLHSKTDAPIQLKGLLLQLHAQLNKQPFRIHSDRGSEFIGGTLSDWLITRGIKWTGSAAHAHQQNGLIERTNRTIFEALRASHIHANIPSKLWSTTIVAVVDTLNNGSSSGPSPFEKAFGTAPTLCPTPLGCRVIFQKDEKAPLPKLAPRTTEGVFLGKTHGVAHIMDIATKRVITRRDYTAFPHAFPLRTRVARISFAEVSPALALTSPKREQWYRAMNAELNAMREKKVWSLVPKNSLPPGTRIMSGTWVLREKATGFKARWCARGFTEPDAKNVFADVLQSVSMRLFFAYAAQHNYAVRHVDITSAFLNASLDEPIYMVQPYHLPHMPGMVCKLQKAIYGLRTAPRRWQETLSQSLIGKGFQRLQGDRNLYRRGPMLMSVYVDDFKLTGPAIEVESALKDLQSLYQVKDLGPISSYLGMEVLRTPEGGYKLTQVAKVEALLQFLDQQQARSSIVPIPDDNRIDCGSGDVLTDDQAKLYRSAVGQLLHISLVTRPDIAYAVMRLTQRFALPTQNALHALKSVGRYLRGTTSTGLYFKPSSTTILGSSDSSWSTLFQSKATTGNVFMVNGAPVAWKAKRQSLTAQSTCESEYVAASTAATQARWLLPLINEMWQEDHGPITLQMDNQAAIATATTGGLTARNRHFLIRQAVLREALDDRIIKIAYTPSQNVIADGLTKALQKNKHADFIAMLQLI